MRQRDQFPAGGKLFGVTGARHDLKSAEKDEKECDAAAQADANAEHLTDKLLRVRLDASECRPRGRTGAHAGLTLPLF